MKKIRLRKKTKNPSEVMRKKCVDEAKKINKELANRICDYCGSADRMVHSHHIFSEGLNKSMSADVDNLICVCWLHHLGGLKFVKSSTFSFHGSPADAMEWFKEKYPQRMKKLKQKAKLTIQCDLQFWENKLKLLNKEYQKLCRKQKQNKRLPMPF